MGESLQCYREAPPTLDERVLSYAAGAMINSAAAAAYTPGPTTDNRADSTHAYSIRAHMTVIGSLHQERDVNLVLRRHH